MTSAAQPWDTWGGRRRVRQRQGCAHASCGSARGSFRTPGPPAVSAGRPPREGPELLLPGASRSPHRPGLGALEPRAGARTGELASRLQEGVLHAHTCPLSARHVCSVFTLSKFDPSQGRRGATAPESSRPTCRATVTAALPCPPHPVTACWGGSPGRCVSVTEGEGARPLRAGPRDACKRQLFGCPAV